ncbi:transcriptional regulator, PadR family [Quadrisphaera granulorum]|uniref:PadR family transcriptional regulator n=1 Tax=Quadrisphaera granulorum TaxID=317664 RepID=A0A316A6S9_9ACTN|nr:PadR family transcriptional regulator [Quadrisphaera granulorum]PWJ52524.1 PadR family transcriptional regulator [Quadrisphaera granulorum]SZE97574.1 transcriptional regulator, PadR family [Quadrisphaera granulorum]
MTADADRRTQLLRGSLDTCLLALLDHTPTHAYDLVVQLERHGLPDISYGTVYPLMTRLRRQGLVSEQPEPSASGPPRKVFHLTAQGRSALATWVQQWSSTTATITYLLTAAGALPTAPTTPAPLLPSALPAPKVHNRVDA